MDVMPPGPPDPERRRPRPFGALMRLLRDRFAPAFLLVGGATLVAGGVGAQVLPGPAASPSPSPSPVASAARTPDAILKLIVIPTEPRGSLAPDRVTPSVAPATPPPAPGSRVRWATRVVVPALGIDLPIMGQPGGPGTYPACDVAFYIRELGQPGEGRATYLYAHARRGMFLPLLEASRVERGAAMVGILVEVYTSDAQVYVYQVSEVRPHQLDLNDAAMAVTEQLWLQTSEGPKGTVPKLQVVAQYLTHRQASQVDSNPVPRPVACD